MTKTKPKPVRCPQCGASIAEFPADSSVCHGCLLDEQRKDARNRDAPDTINVMDSTSLGWSE